MTSRREVAGAGRAKTCSLAKFGRPSASLSLRYWVEIGGAVAPTLRGLAHLAAS